MCYNYSMKHEDTHTHFHEDGSYTHTHDGVTHTHGPHTHVHSEQEKKAVINRLSRAAGHIEAIKRMVENDEDCSQVLIQIAAVEAALKNTSKVVLKNHMDHCIREAVEQGDDFTIEQLKNAIDKLI